MTGDWVDTPELFDLAGVVLFKMRLEHVLDIGSSNRPQKLIPFPLRHVCVDPCQEALDLLPPGRFERWNMTAAEALARARTREFDAIVMLDVIEHMEKDDGIAVIEAAIALEPRVIVVFTPLGFVPQEAHGLGGEWLRHRSGWTPEDFRGRWVFIHGVHQFGLDPLNGRTDPVPCFFAIGVAPPPPKT